MPDSWQTTEEADISTDTKKYDDIAVSEEMIEDVPPRPGSIYVEVVGRLIEVRAENPDEKGWLSLTTGGRSTNSVQSGLQSAAKSLGVKVQTKSQTVDKVPKVYVRLRLAEAEKDGGAEEGEGSEE